MATLVDKILSIEQQANDLVASARVEAKSLEAQADGELAAYRRKLAEDCERRIAAYRNEAEARHKVALAGAEAEFNKKAALISSITPRSARNQIERIFSRFREA